MIRYTTCFLVLATCTALSGYLHYKDNEALLYCEVICKVDNTEHKAGLYPKNSVAETIKVRGKWTAEGIFMTTSGIYIVTQKTMKAIQAKCADMQQQLFAKPKIKSLLEDCDISGVTEKQCKIYPRVTTALGAVVFKVVSDPNEEQEKEL